MLFTPVVKAFLKKALWIFLGVVGVVLTIALILPLFFRNKQTDLSPLKEVLDKAKLQIDRAEIDAQIARARAASKEKETIDKLIALKDEPDRRKRLEQLSALLK